MIHVNIIWIEPFWIKETMLLWNWAHTHKTKRKTRIQCKKSLNGVPFEACKKKEELHRLNGNQQLTNNLIISWIQLPYKLDGKPLLFSLFIWKRNKMRSMNSDLCIFFWFPQSDHPELCHVHPIEWFLKSIFNSD